MSLLPATGCGIKEKPMKENPDGITASKTDVCGL